MDSTVPLFIEESSDEGHTTIYFLHNVHVSGIEYNQEFYSYT